jgi:RNA polymerase sigma factor (TIGR02999 family)
VAPTISVLIASTESGDRSAADALFTALYAELHQLAERQLARRGSDLTLGVTTLLHEAYLDMAQREGTVFPDKGRFMAYAARVMRSLILDYVRDHRAQKRGGEFQITTLDEERAPSVADGTDLQGVGAALERLTSVDPALAEVVDLKFFCGFSLTEVAAMRGVSERTIQRRWEKARIYLRSVLGDARSGSDRLA